MYIISKVTLCIGIVGHLLHVGFCWANYHYIDGLNLSTLLFYQHVHFTFVYHSKLYGLNRSLLCYVDVRFTSCIHWYYTVPLIYFCGHLLDITKIVLSYPSSDPSKPRDNMHIKVAEAIFVNRIILGLCNMCISLSICVAFEVFWPHIRPRFK